MQNLQITKDGYFIVLFITIMLLPVNAFSTAQQADNWLNEPVTIRFQNEPLNKVLEKVSKQTGIAILYDQELANEKVSGNYKDVKASDAITRLFGSKNKSIQVSKDKKVIVVKTFGAKNFIWAVSGQGMHSKDNETGAMTLAELNKLHEQQYKEYKEQISNENEMLPEVGMTRGELRAMHERQYKEYEEQVANDNEFLPEVGMTRGELLAMHERQYKEHEKQISNEKEFLPEVGMTRGELRAMHERQYKEYEEQVANDDVFLPEVGMSRGELNAMHKKQNKLYQERKKYKERVVVE